MKPKSILLASGGLDSTTLAYWLEHKGIISIPVFINYGQHCAKTELETLLEVLPETFKALIEVINISDVYKGSSSRLIDEPNLWTDHVEYSDLYLPYRNLLFLTMGAAYAQTKNCSTVYSAFINSNHATELDASAHFFDQLEILMSEYGTIKIAMPFRDKSKYEVAKLGISLSAPIGRTFSCQAAALVPCGACPNCVDRLDALERISNENYQEEKV